MATPTKTLYITVDLGSCGNSIAEKLRKARINGTYQSVCEVAGDILQTLPQYGGIIKAEVLGSDGTAASQTVTWTAAAAKGSGDVNGKAFTFIAGSAGACTVTVGSVTGITITGSGTAATDATAMALAINTALAPVYNPAPTVTANAGDVRIVWGVKGDVGNPIATVVTATGGAKLTAAGATLAGGTPTGALGSVTVNGGSAVALGSVTSGETAAATAARILALMQADAASALLVASACALATDVVLTLTAKVPPSIAAVGNRLTLSASVGTAGGATFAGGANSSIAKGSL